MKKLITLIAVVALAAAACSSKKEAPLKLTSGTPAYTLAKQASKVCPALDPDKTTTVVSTKSFDITAADVMQMLVDSMGPQRAGQFATLDAARMKTVVNQAAEQIGGRRLLLNAAAAAQKTATLEEIKTALDAQYAGAGGEEKFIELLKSNGMTLDTLKKGITEDLTLKKYLDGILAPAGQVAAAEVQKAYQEDKTASVRHILLVTQGKTAAEKAAARKKIEDILAEARKGGDFAELAKKYTEDEGSKANGGLYEDFPRGKMVKPFEEAAFSVPVGQISGVVETDFGYHIIKVENRKKETKPFDEVKAALEAQIKQRKEMAALETYMAGLKKQAGYKLIAL